MPASTTITPAHIHWFRLRRSGLVEPFATPEETARALLGVQAQLPPAAGVAFFNRTTNCTSQDLDRARLELRSLVRMWGQRNTVHMYSSADWPFLHTVFEERGLLMKKRFEKAGLLGEFQRVVRRIGKRLESGARLTHRDVKSKKLEGQQDRWVVSYAVFMQLVREGAACFGEDKANESSFVHRSHWIPDLEWSPPDAIEGQAELARRYLSAYGPAEPQDLAFWYGTSVTNAKRWIASAGDDVVSVDVGCRTYWYCEADREDLSAKPPHASKWPVRMLYRFDPLVLATKDKSWLIDEEHYKKVWLPSAHVAAVLLVRGRIAGTWRYDRKAKGLHVRVSPFGKIAASVAKEARREAVAIAGFFGLDLGAFEVT